MPKRNRSREAKKLEDAATAPSSLKASSSKKSSGKKRGGSKKATAKRPKKTGPKSKPDPSDTPDTVVHYVMQGDSERAYLCPGCQRDIPAKLSHIVAVPPEVDLRRHWHRACWENRRPNR